MRLTDLAVVYLVVGLGCAWALRRRKGNALDGLLTLALWPLYVPMLLGPPAATSARSPTAPRMSTRVARERELLTEAIGAARARIGATTLGELLPSDAQALRLIEQIARLDAKVHELDAVLAGDDFDPSRIERRGREAASDVASTEGARAAIESARRLTAMRERAVRERDELLGLCARLRMHMTVLRFSDATTAGEGGDLGELLSEILGRIEGVGAALEPDAARS